MITSRTAACGSLLMPDFYSDFTESRNLNMKFLELFERNVLTVIKLNLQKSKTMEQTVPSTIYS